MRYNRGHWIRATILASLALFPCWSWAAQSSADPETARLVEQVNAFRKARYGAPNYDAIARFLDEFIAQNPPLVPSYPDQYYPPFTEEQRAMYGAWFQKNDAMLRKADAVFAKGRAWAIITPGEPVERGLSHELNRLRDILIVRAQLGIAEGKPQEAPEWLLRAIRAQLSLFAVDAPYPGAMMTRDLAATIRAFETLVWVNADDVTIRAGLEGLNRIAPQIEALRPRDLLGMGGLLWYAEGSKMSFIERHFLGAQAIGSLMREYPDCSDVFQNPKNRDAYRRQRSKIESSPIRALQITFVPAFEKHMREWIREEPAFSSESVLPKEVLEQMSFPVLLNVLRAVGEQQGLAGELRAMQDKFDAIRLAFAERLFHAERGRYARLFAELTPKYLPALSSSMEQSRIGIMKSGTYWQRQLEWRDTPFDGSAFGEGPGQADSNMNLHLLAGEMNLALPTTGPLPVLTDLRPTSTTSVVDLRDIPREMLLLKAFPAVVKDVALTTSTALVAAERQKATATQAMNPQMMQMMMQMYGGGGAPSSGAQPGANPQMMQMMGGRAAAPGAGAPGQGLLTIRFAPEVVVIFSITPPLPPSSNSEVVTGKVPRPLQGRLVTVTPVRF